MTDQPLLTVDHLTVAYGRGARRRTVVPDASFTVGGGEVVGLIGETGSGKSTLARTIVGLVPADGGRVTIDGEDVTAFSPAAWRAFRRRGVVQYVFQDPMRSLDPDVTLGGSVAEPLLLQGNPSREQVDARVRDGFRQVHLDEALLDRRPGQVSGGQRQRAAIARALVTRPKLLVLDEPVSALDSANRVQVLELLQELAAPGVGILFISHDLGSVAGITDRVVVLFRGEVVESGTTESVIVRPEHPYTQLLVGSAPTLARGDDPARTGGDDPTRTRTDTRRNP